VVEYRKSGLSLNHIQGCPLDCAYCIRHTYGLWDQRQPRALMPDAEAVELLVSHRYFQAHLTPVQLLNRATDPFLESSDLPMSRGPCRNVHAPSQLSFGIDPLA
jgi:DNA repair photolyase